VFPLIAGKKKWVVLTGAGVSVESGIPSFRGRNGLWERYDPAEFAHIRSFLSDPEKVWGMLGELYETLFAAKPGAAHCALARLEQKGYICSLITQNVDGLHQEGGSDNVLELHGNALSLVCMHCGKKYGARKKVKMAIPPRCECGEILKPGIVFFGEPIPKRRLVRARRDLHDGDLFMVVGTSATVSPANLLPEEARRRGIPIIEINREKTLLSSQDGVTSIFGKAGDILPCIADRFSSRRFPHNC